MNEKLVMNARYLRMASVINWYSFQGWVNGCGEVGGGERF